MIVHALKTCGRCKQPLPLTDFCRNVNGRYGVHSVCRKCSTAYYARKRANFSRAGTSHIPEEKRCGACSRTFPASHFSRGRYSADGLKSWCKECTSVIARTYKYGITEERVLEMLSQVACEACGCALDRNQDKHVDHRHSDGAVRGVLCTRCNTTIGKCEESPRILRQIAAYIERSSGVDYRLTPYPVTRSGCAGQ